MIRFVVTLTAAALCAPGTASADVPAFFAKHCTDCHDAAKKKGDLDLTALKPDFANAETFARWVKVHDRIVSGEMPPKKHAQPEAAEVKEVTKWLGDGLVKAEQARLDLKNRTSVRRLTRAQPRRAVSGDPPRVRRRPPPGRSSL